MSLSCLGCHTSRSVATGSSAARTCGSMIGTSSGCSPTARKGRSGNALSTDVRRNRASRPYGRGEAYGARRFIYGSSEELYSLEFSQRDPKVHGTMYDSSSPGKGQVRGALYNRTGDGSPLPRRCRGRT